MLLFFLRETNTIEKLKGEMQQFREHFPRLQPLRILGSPEGFEGFIEIQGNDYYINIKTPYFPTAKNIIIDADIELLEAIQSHCSNEAVSEDSSVADYLQNLKGTLESVFEIKKLYNVQNTDPFVYCSVLISHIERLGWKRVVQISPDFSSLILGTNDFKNRAHSLLLKIPPKYPADPPIVEADLPRELNFRWTQTCDLSDIFAVWQEQLEKLQLFWDVMDSLDETSKVIDPVNPMRKHTTRRVVLENQVSIQLQVSPEHPSAPPKCHLLGPSSLVSPLNDKIVGNIQNWDPSDSIVSNFEHLLGLSVVKKHGADFSNTQEWEVECAVCYALHLEEQLPDLTCDHCQKSFHLSCLYNWLKCLPSSRQTAQFIRGDCPYCTKAISCKVPL